MDSPASERWLPVFQAGDPALYQVTVAGGMPSVPMLGLAENFAWKVRNECRP